MNKNTNKSFVNFLKTAGYAFVCISCVFSVYGSSVEEKIEEYINGLSSLMAEFTQISMNNSQTDKGAIYIKRKTKNTKTKVLVSYESGEVESITLNGRFLTIIDRRTHKSKTYSILTTPIYALLAGELKLKDLTHQVIEDNNQYVVILIKYDGQDFVLTFQKRDNKISRLIGWAIGNSTSSVELEFDKEKYYENDITKVPDSIFENNKGK